MREGRHGEARGADLVDSGGLHQAGAARRRARPGRGLLVRRRAPQSLRVKVLRVQGAHLVNTLLNIAKENNQPAAKFTLLIVSVFSKLSENLVATTGM